ncbi:MAG: histone deacetylase [Gemmataceae bacterium]|nr:histone deacetylase [Gemmataceae bacterium]
MKVFRTDQFEMPLPEGHPFPGRKYAGLYARVAESGLVRPEEIVVPAAVSNEDLLRVHDADYVRRMSNGELTDAEVRRLGFPWSPELVQRSRRTTGGTIEACREALDRGWGINLAGGTHHAFADRGEGYCLFNDAAVAIRVMQAERRIARAVIVDADVHQGNGTAAIFAADPTVYTFSIHNGKNYPLKKESSDLDIELDDGAGDAEFLAELERGLEQAIPQSRADLLVYLAGADPFWDDRFGRLKLTKAGLSERDRMVFDHAEAAGLAMAVVMAGGYSRRLDDLIDIHFQTVEESIRRARRRASHY